MNWEFIENLVLVLVPSITGIISSRFLLHSWQIRKEKFNLRHKILDDFQKTYPTGIELFYAFYHELASFYTTIPKNIKYEGAKIQADWKYPSEDENTPRKKISKEYEKLKE